MPGLQFQNLTSNTSLYSVHSAQSVELAYNLLAVCFSGMAQVEINNSQWEFKTMDVALILKGSKVKVNKLSDNYYGYLIKVDDIIYQRMSLMRQSTQYKYLQSNPIVALQPDSYKIILNFKKLFDLLCQRDESSLYFHQIVQSLFTSFELEISQSFYANQKGDTVVNKDRLIFTDFMQTLKKEHTKERTVEFYASYYAMSRRGFSRIIKEVSGKSPKELINEEIIKTAKYLLLNSDLTVLEISDRLNFAHQSAFGFFFKKETGYTPIHFRSQAHINIDKEEIERAS